jgi:hypothetical protein
MKEKNPARRYVVGGGAGNDALADRGAVTNLIPPAQAAHNVLPAIEVMHRPLSGNADHWEVIIDGVGEISGLSTEELHSNTLFNRACMLELQRCFASISPADWFLILDNAMRRGRQS